MIGNYERNLFEQQTPYLQWLKERKTKQMIKKESIKGKQIIKLPFFSCEDSVKEVVKESPEVLRNTHIVVFYGANGVLEKDAECFFAEYFDKHEDVVLAYADEDYLGGLQEFYGEKVQETEYSGEYHFNNTSYFRGEPWFKPDYSPDTLRSFFYYGNVFAIRGAVLAEVLATESQQNIYDMVIALSKKYDYAGHISEILFTNGVKMQEKHSGLGDEVDCACENESLISNENTKKEINGLCKQNLDNKLISVVIPSKDNSNILKTCLLSLVEYTDYPYYEIILVDNGSTEQELKCIRELIGIPELVTVIWIPTHIFTHRFPVLSASQLMKSL